MSEQREFEGTTLEDAILQASEQLTIPESELHYEVVEQGRKGLLGLGSKNVRIRVKPPVHELTDEEILVGESETPPARSGPAPEAAPSVSAKPDAKASDKKRPRESPAPPSAPPAEERPPVQVSPAAAEQIGNVEQTLGKMFELTGLEMQIASAPEEGGVTLQLDGKDGKLLKKRNGELLGAYQFLLNRMARRTWPEVGRIHVALAGVGNGRDEKLVKLTRSVAKQVSKTGRTKKMRPMNAYERRLVHLTVREFNGLTSSSDGNGSMKRVRISKVRNEIGA